LFISRGGWQLVPGTAVPLSRFNQGLQTSQRKRQKALSNKPASLTLTFSFCIPKEDPPLRESRQHGYTVLEVSFESIKTKSVPF